MNTVHRKDLDLRGLGDITGAAIMEREDGYRLTWDGGDYLEIHRDADSLHFDYLFSQTGRHRLTQLVSLLPGFFRERGITAFVTTSGAANAAMLRLRVDR